MSRPLIAFFLLATFSNAAELPNVLFIAIDDLNHWAIDKSEFPHAITPNIDRLAKRGVTFTNAHCAAPGCNASRTALLTGVAPYKSGVYVNGQDWRENSKLKMLKTLPESFKENGYKTMGGGKIYHAHSLTEKAYEGFIDPKPWDTYFPSESQQMPVEIDPPNMPENGNPKFYGGHMDWSILDITDDEMADGKVVSWAEKQLAQDHEMPLFLAIGIYRPHVPWYTPRSWFDLYPEEMVALPKVRDDDLDDIPEAGQDMARRNWQQWMIDNDQWQKFVRGYLASVSFADAMVGRLLDALDNGPMAKNTVIVLWSDHGYHLGHKEHWEKFTLWEQASRVPLIFASPEFSTSADKSTNYPASLLDIYPTLLDLCGLVPPPHLDGESIQYWIRYPDAPSDRAVLITHEFKNHAVRTRDWRYLHYEDGSEELYDHRNDPHEFTNLAEDPEYAAKKRELASQLPKENAKPSPKSKQKKKTTKNR